MDAILQAILRLENICVFGGVWRDVLRGRKYNDIDVFVKLKKEIFLDLLRGEDLTNCNIYQNCKVKPLKAAQEIALMLVEEFNYKDVEVQPVYCTSAYGHSVGQNFRVVYGENQKIDVICLGCKITSLLDFDVNCLYWDGELKSLLPTTSVSQILDNLSRNIAKQNYMPTFDELDTNKDRKFFERVEKMERYGFSMTGDKAIRLKPIYVKSCPKIHLQPLLPPGYFLTGLAAVLHVINGPKCRHVTVYGRNICKLQEELPFSTEIQGDKLLYPEGSITLVSELNSDVDIYNIYLNAKSKAIFSDELFCNIIKRRYVSNTEHLELEIFEFGQVYPK